MERNRWRRAAVAGMLVGAVGLASLVTTTMSSAQTVTIDRSPWRMFIPPTPNGAPSNGQTDINDAEPWFVDASIPDAADPGWQSAPDPDVIGFDGQTDPNFGGGQASRLTGCGTGVDYTYFETTITVPPGVTPSTFTVDFVNIDDAAQISIFNSANQAGTPGSDATVLADSGGTQTGNLADKLVEGENRVVIVQMDNCNPGNTLQSATITLDGTEVPVEEDAPPTTIVEDTTTTTEVPPEPIPPGSFGDVHFRTPDALVFDIQDVGDFVLLQSTDGSVVIQSRQEALDIRPGVSINTATVMNVAGDSLEFYLNPEPTLLVNGVDTPLPDGPLDLPQGGLVSGSITQSTIGPEETEPNDFQIDWPDGNTAARVLFKRDSHLDIGVVRLGGDLTFEGVLGNLDGDPDNDMTLRDGTVIEQPANENKVRRFADSWRVPEPESLVSVGEAPVPAPGAAEDLVTPDDLDPAAVEEATQACQDAGVDDPLAVETCVYDVAATGNEDFVDSSATLQEAVEELPESTPEPVFATEEPDLVPDESSSSFPWILIAAIAVVLIVLIVVLVARANSKKKTQGGPPANPPVAQGAGPPAGGAPGSGV
ncbi:MAG: hypothetical protein JNK12_03410 [Acidimicrobiales bacterium]|nr:hypothetical protein [Acidimicrobiales bacterium]